MGLRQAEESRHLFRLDDRAAVVTGGTRGIGRAISLSLAQAGAKLILNYVSDDAAAAATAEQVERLGASVALVRGDVAERETAQRVIGEAQKRYGRIDILVNNVG